MRRRLSFFTLLLVFLPASPSLAQDNSRRTLWVVNDTSAEVNQLFVTGGGNRGLRAKVNGILGAPADERDRLDAKLLRRGGVIEIALKGRRCSYDIRAVLADGRSYVADDFNVCANDRWSVSSGTRR